MSCCCLVALINLQAATEMMVIKGSCIPPFNPFGGALRDIPKDGCEEDYWNPRSVKSFANSRMQTIPVRVDTLQRQTMASTGRGGPPYNQILTPPLASGRVRSQTLATVQYSKCT